MTKQPVEVNQNQVNATAEKTTENISETSLPEANSEPKILPKAVLPIAKKPIVSEFSISAALNKKDEEQTSLFEETKQENLPEHHFTEKDLQTEWQNFLSDLLIKDDVIYYAVNTLKLHKLEENVIEILYPTNSARTEFEKIQGDFFNHFKRKVQNYKIEIKYRNDIGLKKEIITKKMIFEKYMEINPVLKDLDDLMKFDFS